MFYHLGKDFRPSNVSLVIPPSFEDPTTSTFIINQSNFDIVDDRINEYSQSFALFVEIEPHQEMSGETQVCFKNPMSGQGCSDFGAAEIVILDNDRKYFTNNCCFSVEDFDTISLFCS